MNSTASAVGQRAPKRWTVVLGLILYCAACWGVVAFVADSVYQFASPPQAEASADGVTGANRTAR
jgi:hypothetical protein